MNLNEKTTMSIQEQISSFDDKEKVKKMIALAFMKTGVKTECELSAYIPCLKNPTIQINPTEFSRLKYGSPKNLCNKIEELILKPNHPERLLPINHREKKSVSKTTSKDRLEDLTKEQLITLFRSGGFSGIKDKLLASIQSDEPKDELWNLYKLSLVK